MYAVSGNVMSSKIHHLITREKVFFGAIERSISQPALPVGQIVNIEEKMPDPNAMIICHCGGGGRSTLAAETLQKMGYKNVRSMAGGISGWEANGVPTKKRPRECEAPSPPGNYSFSHSYLPNMRSL